MFDKFYNFSGLPFLLTPDSRFFFGSSGHSRAMAHLVYGLSQQEGFIVQHRAVQPIAAFAPEHRIDAAQRDQVAM